MHEAVIVDAVRTPFGRRGGAYAGLRPDALLASSLSSLLERTSVDPSRLGDILTGCVSQAGEQSANVGRQAALLAGVPIEVPAVTLNRMCSSGQSTVHFAAQAVIAGDMDYAVACGVESMSRTPMFLDVTLGAGPFRDWSMLNADLLAAHELPPQAQSAELMAAKWGLTREELDDFAAQSHRKAMQHAASLSNPRETVPVHGLGLVTDEGVRGNVDRAKMASLVPVTHPDGVITAANSSQMTDGAASLLVGREDAVRADGMRARARFRARVVVGSDPRIQLDGVIPATRAALGKAGLSMSDLHWIEVNEAFACVPVGWARELAVDLVRVNPWGGAIAHGHPLGATGVGLVAKALAGLEATGGSLALVVFCAGHGLASATILERM
ncbi:thiolase family protein [Pseudorhodoferax soli]|uniref:Acetyl-CoA C-acetyltransferase/acetyl-CoA acyltransferase n=1 Tax=Pseudorhodoferax soli TaxID=545864 RepID=A0A368XKW2_9BURK|nr:thiolase family protein [Pseudorhodoferax soli]RCW68612.1 acetyl-CoA C-acetyltransferase/acetyl-CoA acyltransferase [Pseudorhodoferax soli]